MRIRNLAMTLLLSFDWCGGLQQNSFAQDRRTWRADEEYGTGDNAVLSFYQRWISPVKGGNLCPMHPSCSQYGKLLFQSQSALPAYIATCERLLRCGRELYLYKMVGINEGFHWYDPPPMTSRSNRNTSHAISPLHPRPDTATPPQFATPSRAEEGFADFLFENGEYERASTEYLRLAYYGAADTARQRRFLQNIGNCLYLGADYDGCIKFIERHRSRFNRHPEDKSALELLLGKTYYQLQRYDKVITTLQWSGATPQQTAYDETQFMLGLCYARLYFWDTAAEHLAKVRETSAHGVMARNISASLNKGPSLPTRHPWVAGTLSTVIPGAGYFYARRPNTAVASFLINSLIFWTIRDAIKDKNYGIATTTAFFGIGWYFGNIKGSRNAARQFNANVRDRFLERLLENAAPEHNVSKKIQPQ